MLRAVAALFAGAAAYTPTHLRGVLTVAKAQLVEQQREELLDRQEGIGSLLEYGKPFAYYYRILEKQRRRAEAGTELLNDVSKPRTGARTCHKSRIKSILWG